jgi:hypothetical protein
MLVFSRTAAVGRVSFIGVATPTPIKGGAQAANGSACNIYTQRQKSESEQTRKHKA